MVVIYTSKAHVSMAYSRNRVSVQSLHSMEAVDGDRPFSKARSQWCAAALAIGPA